MPQTDPGSGNPGPTPPGPSSNPVDPGQQTPAPSTPDPATQPAPSTTTTEATTPTTAPEPTSRQAEPIQQESAADIVAAEIVSINVARKAVDRGKQADAFQDFVTQLEQFGYLDGLADVSAKARALVSQIRSGNEGAAYSYWRVAALISDGKLKLARETLEKAGRGADEPDLPDDLRPAANLINERRQNEIRDFREAIIEMNFLRAVNEYDQGTPLRTVSTMFTNGLRFTTHILEWKESPAVSAYRSKIDSLGSDEFRDIAVEIERRLTAYSEGTYSDRMTDLAKINENPS